MKHPYISVIVPAYNASVSLVKLLQCLRASTYTNFEVIIGDDASFEPMEQLCGDVAKRCKFPVVFVRLKKNTGPAGARNAAAKKAKGIVLVFFDSDVEPYPDTIAHIAKCFLDDPDLTALTGVWDKHQQTNRFFPQYKALRDWSYWINERDRDGYYYLFSTRVAAIRRKVFVRLGGFNTTFRQMEDVELTYRIARRYAIVFAPEVRVHHEFENFWPIAKKYFWRSFYWMKLYNERKKFDPVATTQWESLAALTAFATVMTVGIGSTMFFLYPLYSIRYYTIHFSLLFLFLHIFLIRKFLLFVAREKGVWFMIRSLTVGIVLYCVIVFGILYFYVTEKLKIPSENIKKY